MKDKRRVGASEIAPDMKVLKSFGTIGRDMFRLGSVEVAVDMCGCEGSVWIKGRFG